MSFSVLDISSSETYVLAPSSTLGLSFLLCFIFLPGLAAAWSHDLFASFGSFSSENGQLSLVFMGTGSRNPCSFLI